MAQVKVGVGQDVPKPCVDELPGGVAFSIPGPQQVDKLPECNPKPKIGGDCTGPLKPLSDRSDLHLTLNPSDWQTKLKLNPNDYLFVAGTADECAATCSGDTASTSWIEGQSGKPKANLFGNTDAAIQGYAWYDTKFLPGISLKDPNAQGGNTDPNTDTQKIQKAPKSCLCLPKAVTADPTKTGLCFVPNDNSILQGQHSSFALCKNDQAKACTPGAGWDGANAEFSQRRSGIKLLPSDSLTNNSIAIPTANNPKDCQLACQTATICGPNDNVFTGSPFGQESCSMGAYAPNSGCTCYYAPRSPARAPPAPVRPPPKR